MKQEKKSKKFIILGLISCLLIIGGIYFSVSYGFFKNSKVQEIGNVISTPTCLDISLDETEAINLASQFPISDEDGMASKPYTFTVTNNCTTITNYQINLESLPVSTVSDGSIKVAINDKVGLYSQYGETDKYYESSKNARTLMSGTLKGKESKTYDLRLWVDENAPVTEQGKNFESKIIITGGLDAVTATESGIEAERGSDHISLEYKTTGTNTTCSYGYSIGNYQYTVDDATSTSCNITNIDPNKTVYYKVCTTTVRGELCEDGVIKTTHVPPTINTPNQINTTTDEIVLSFSSTGEETKTTCKYGETEGEYDSFGIVENDTCTISNLSSNTSYYYEICVVNNGGKSCTNGSKKTELKESSISNVTNNKTTNGIELSYVSGGDEISVTCKYGTSEGNYPNDATTITNSGCSITNLEDDETYYYQVCINNGVGSKCETGSITTLLKSPSLSNRTATSTYNSINIGYTATGKRSTVTCKYGEQDGNYPSNGTVSDNECSITGLDEDKLYYYQVCITNDSGTDCNTGSTKTTLNPPTINTPTSTSTYNSISISYTTTGLNTSVTCKYGTSEGSYENDATTVTNSGCSITGLEEGTPYYYQVCISNSSGSVCKEGSETTGLAAPTITNPTATSTNNTISITYTTTGKNITTTCKYGTSEGSYSNDATTVTNSGCSITSGLIENTPYYYQVCTTNIGGSVCKEGSITTKYNAPTLSDITSSSTHNTISLSYTESGTVTSRTCKYGTSEGNYSNTADNPTNTGCSITGLTANTPYYYEVCITNNGGESCKTGNITTKNTPPTITDPEAISTSSTISITYTTTGNSITTTCKYGTSEGNYSNDATTVTNSGCSITSGLTENIPYYYQVCVTNNGGSVCKEGAITTKVPPKCKRATTLHTETCNKTGGAFCSSIGHGNTITYGNATTTPRILNTGDAFDCDVDGTGYNHRFYYVSDLYTGGGEGSETFDNSIAVLMYYSNTIINGTTITSNNTTAVAYNSVNINYQGPLISVANIPGNDVWTNLSINETRQIRSETGTTTTNKGKNAITFSGYTNKAARLITTQEINRGCGLTNTTMIKDGALDTPVCRFLLENTKYGTASNLYGYFLETPLASSNRIVWYINGSGRYVSESYASESSVSGVRLAIEVAKSDIEY